MKKHGFTLAEVLIALAIVGVISALTLPTLVSEHRKQVNAASLSKAVSDFETAMQGLVLKEDVLDLTRTTAWSILPAAGLDSGTAANTLNAFMGELNQGMEFKSHQSGDGFYNNNLVRPLNGNNASALIQPFFTNSTAFTGKNGFTYFIRIQNPQGGGFFNNITENVARRDGVSLRSPAASVMIDVNGTEMPNMIGRDVFLFILGTDGVLYPYGGPDVEYHLGSGNASDKWSTDGATFRCSGNAVVSDGLGCAARLIQNGYKVDY